MASQNAQQEHVYHAQDAVSAALKATTLTGGVGLFASAVQNTLTKQNIGPMGVFVKSGGTIGIFGMEFSPGGGERGEERGFRVWWTMMANGDRSGNGRFL